jgi:hypothetical protein
MRALAVILLLAFAVVAAASARPAIAMQASPHSPAQGIAAQQQVDDNDDTRVDVQVVVLAIAAGLVVGVGSLAFALRWKLGRTTYDRDAAEKALAHH